MTPTTDRKPLYTDPLTPEEAAELPMPDGATLEHDGRRWVVAYRTPVSDPWSLAAHAAKMVANGRSSRRLLDRVWEIIEEEVGS